VIGWLNAGIVEEDVARQRRFHGNAQTQQSGVSCWLARSPCASSTNQLLGRGPVVSC
jgi:hypothetical protein